MYVVVYRGIYHMGYLWAQSNHIPWSYSTLAVGSESRIKKPTIHVCYMCSARYAIIQGVSEWYSNYVMNDTISRNSYTLIKSYVEHVNVMHSTSKMGVWNWEEKHTFFI